MKRFLYILLAFVLVSCTSELDYENKTPGDSIVLNVYNSPMTKADLGEDTDYERTLNRLDCFFYKKGQTGGNCVYYIKQTPGSVGASEIVVDVNDILCLRCR